jgi:hypothetical protein
LQAGDLSDLMIPKQWAFFLSCHHRLMTNPTTAYSDDAVITHQQ